MHGYLFSSEGDPSDLTDRTDKRRIGESVPRRGRRGVGEGAVEGESHGFPNFTSPGCHKGVPLPVSGYTTNTNRFKEVEVVVVGR
jgi:hypothetical protein